MKNINFDLLFKASVIILLIFILIINYLDYSKETTFSRYQSMNEGRLILDKATGDVYETGDKIVK